MTNREKVAFLREYIRKYGPDDAGIGWHPSQGWAIFDMGEGHKMVQRIDDLSDVFGITDWDARRAAIGFGYRFDDKSAPYRVTGWPQGEK